MPTDALGSTTTQLGQLTSGELANALRATSFLLGHPMQQHISDRTLVAKLSSLHLDLEAEENDRKRLNGK